MTPYLLRSVRYNGFRISLVHCIKYKKTLLECTFETGKKYNGKYYIL